jgi:hypothetical protein
MKHDKKIFHFHFYKNAGSSVDAILRNSFVHQWEEKEFDDSPLLTSSVINWITNSKTTICFSSHTAKLDIMNVQNMNMMPLLFVRHPIDRIASVYRYEKLRNGNSWEDHLAGEMSMRQYIQTRLDRAGDAQCRNYHCSRLSEMFRVFENVDKSDFELAQQAVDRLPFIGVVERFQESLKMFEKLFHEAGFQNLNFEETRENATSSPGLDIHTRLKDIEKEIGSDFFNLLLNINGDDILIYEMVIGKLDQKIRYGPRIESAISMNELSFVNSSIIVRHFNFCPFAQASKTKS